MQGTQRERERERGTRDEYNRYTRRKCGCAAGRVFPPTLSSAVVRRRLHSASLYRRIPLSRCPGAVRKHVNYSAYARYILPRCARRGSPPPLAHRRRRPRDKSRNIEANYKLDGTSRADFPRSRLSLGSRTSVFSHQLLC